jgi:VanZ family protein
MYPLRWRAWWWLGGASLVALVAVLSLIPSPPEMGGSDKLGHISAYAALAIWFAGLYPRQRYWRILAGLFALGLIIEVLQGLSGYRQAEFLDLIANLTGTGIGLSLGLLFPGGWCARIEHALHTPDNPDQEGRDPTGHD